MVVGECTEWIISQMFDHWSFCCDRISVNIAAYGEHCVRRFYFFGIISALVKLSDIPVTFRVIVAVFSIDMPHDFR